MPIAMNRVNFQAVTRLAAPLSQWAPRAGGGVAAGFWWAFAPSRHPGAAALRGAARFVSGVTAAGTQSLL